MVVSYFEWVQDLQLFFWEETEVNRNLKRIMVNSFDKVWGYSHEQQVPLRVGAYMMAVDKVESYPRPRGLSLGFVEKSLPTLTPCLPSEMRGHSFMDIGKSSQTA